MWRAVERLPGGSVPVAPSDDRELAGAVAWVHAHGTFFDRSQSLLLARAPGRLDVMGGFADYSGSLVLEYPVMPATWVAAQACPERQLIIESAAESVTISMDALTPATGPLDYARAHLMLTADLNRAWAAYVAGILVVLHRERGNTLPGGAKVLIRSDVPAGMGLSSSAALVVAAFDALALLAGAEVNDRDLALLSQKVENGIVGAPCGVMDQLTVASGRAGHLIEILCQPAEVYGHIPLPSHLELWGIGSGIRHAVSGADYGSVRAAAFMGHRMIAASAGSDAGVGAYLANVSPAQWRHDFRDLIPEQISGSDFLRRHGETSDAATSVDPGRIYQVRACTDHPILEHERVRRFRDLLGTGAASETECASLGALMYQSHAGYTACGLGSPGTDKLVEMVRAIGSPGGLYGAKITGGGSGGTVAVLARRGSQQIVQQIAARYQTDSGLTCQTVSGSSSGARVFGLHRLIP